MGNKKHDIYPPLDNKRVKIRRAVMRITIDLFALVCVGLLYYLFFSFLFDTPAEYRMKRSTAMLKQEYNELNKRFEEIETVLANVSERDKNVFEMLFESEPYDFTTSFEASRLDAAEQLSTKTNNDLAAMFFDKLQHLNRSTTDTDAAQEKMFHTITGEENRLNNIPAIQPIINKGLTLLTASHGMRIHPFYKSLQQHNGVDYTVPEGTRVFATADGTVKDVIRRPSSSGLTVIISHGNGYETYYNHLSSATVRKGQKVNRGDIIALTGNTGLSISPHLHYEIRYNEEPVDPIHYFFLELNPREYQNIIKIANSGMQSFD